MKKRMGFVSNSSSSSFCIIGIPRNLEDFKNEDFGTKSAYDYTAGGKIFVMTDIDDYGEGMICTYSITKEDAIELKKMQNIDARFYEIIEDIDGEKIVKVKDFIDKIKDYDTLTMLSGTMDINFSMDWMREINKNED